MRILLVTDSFPPQVTPVGEAVASLARGLGSLGDQVAVAAPALTADAGRQPGAVRVPPGGGGEGLLDAMEGFSPDLIHSFDPFGLGADALDLAARLQVPLIVTHPVAYAERVRAQGPNIGSYLAALATRYANECALVQAPTPHLVAELSRRRLRRQPLLLPAPVDGFWTRTSSPSPAEDGATLVVLGEFSERSWTLELLQVARVFLDERRQGRAIFAGRGPLSGALQRFESSHREPHRIEVHEAPSREKVREILGRSDLLLSPPVRGDLLDWAALARPAGLPVVELPPHPWGLAALPEIGAEARRLPGARGEARARRRGAALGAWKEATRRQHDLYLAQVDRPYPRLPHSVVGLLADLRRASQVTEPLWRRHDLEDTSLVVEPAGEDRREPRAGS